MATIDVLLPTCNRVQSLVMVLSGLAGQTYRNFDVIIADQSDEPIQKSPVIKALIRILESHGCQVQVHYRVPSKGIAEQRQFLLDQSSAPYVLYLDDDVWMEPWVMGKMLEVLLEENCGFVGAFPAGLSWRNDIRPAQQRIEFWEDHVHPEAIDPDSPEWQRLHLHRAANLYHVSQKLPAGEVRRYKVAWVASCILYVRQKLIDVGGFSFWSRLPRYHSGEEVLVQNLLMRSWGACGIVPSGTFYSEIPSTVLNEAGTVEGHALSLLPEMIQKYAPEVHPREAGSGLFSPGSQQLADRQEVILVTGKSKPEIKGEQNE